MSEVAIRVQGLGKRYRIGARQAGGRTLREAITDVLVAPVRGVAGLLRRPSEAELIWALQDIDFSLQTGEVLGVIGRNGAGKSTLLKVLSRITEPTCGRVEVRGRIGSLLEVGTGFHPELTGRENIFLNGSVLGMKQREIRRKFDEIVAFSGVETFIDTPVKRYSSGMYVRLAFAVAAHMEPEILLVDEVLAVGDLAFQRKCLGKMDDVARQGRTVLFVSHNLGTIRTLCTRAILLANGRLALDGEVHEVVDAYYREIQQEGARGVTFDPDGERLIEIEAVQVSSPDKGADEPFDIADRLQVELLYRVREDARATNLSVTIIREGVPVFASFDVEDCHELHQRRPAGAHRARMLIPARLLKAGLYSISVDVGHTGIGVIERKTDALVFEINETSEDTRLKGYAARRPGSIIAPVHWEHESR